jgi:hypothetical protein
MTYVSKCHSILLFSFAFFNSEMLGKGVSNDLVELSKINTANLLKKQPSKTGLESSKIR